MRRYETIFITHPDLSKESLFELQEKLNSIMTSWKGSLIKLDDWGTKKLGYGIRKNTRGHYFLLDYLAAPELVRELERNLRLNDGVLKLQTVKIGDQVSADIAKTLKEEASADKSLKVGDRPSLPGEQLATESKKEEGGLVESEGEKKNETSS